MIKLFIVNTLISFVTSHSWVECTHFSITDQSKITSADHSLCKGYPRSFETQYNAGFGIDTGYNQHSQQCKYGITEGAYTSNHPMATYTVGEEICIIHPSKNHVADTCTNQYIPDAGITLYRSSKINQDIFDVVQANIGKKHVKGVIDHYGYQSCYKFCENMDKSVCSSCFKIDDNIEEGIYSFKWQWEFNVDEFYVNCFDAHIIKQSNTPSIVPSITPIATNSSNKVNLACQIVN